MTVQALEPQAIAHTWLSAFSDALLSKDIEGVTSLFLPNGWLRDALVFSWDLRALEGPDRIAGYLRSTLPNAQLKDIELDERPLFAPKTFSPNPNVIGVELIFTFDTPLARGRGVASLLPDSSDEGKWKSFYTYVEVEDIKGHEEEDHELGLYGGHTLEWGDIREERRAEVEKDPEILISESNYECQEFVRLLRTRAYSWRGTIRPASSGSFQTDGTPNIGD